MATSSALSCFPLLCYKYLISQTQNQTDFLAEIVADRRSWFIMPTNEAYNFNNVLFIFIVL